MTKWRNNFSMIQTEFFRHVNPWKLMIMISIVTNPKHFELTPCNQKSHKIHQQVHRPFKENLSSRRWTQFWMIVNRYLQSVVDQMRNCSIWSRCSSRISDGVLTIQILMIGQRFLTSYSKTCKLFAKRLINRTMKSIKLEFKWY